MTSDAPTRRPIARQVRDRPPDDEGRVTDAAVDRGRMPVVRSNERHGSVRRTDGRLPERILGGVRITALTRCRFADLLVEDHRSRRRNPELPPLVSFSANGEMLSMCARDEAYAELIRRADIVDADGQSLVLFSRFWPGAPLPGRVTTTDFFHDAARAAQGAGISFYLLGGTAEVMAKTVENVRRLYPALTIVGARDGYFDVADRDTILAEVARAEPDVLWVGMGSPRQQEFCLYARERLSGVTWIKSCGGLFDYLAGKRSRAPRWMQKAGLEWLYRLGLEPRRLFLRYALTNPHALYLLFARTRVR